MKNTTMLDVDFNNLNNNTDDLDYIINSMEYQWKLDKDIEYLMHQDTSHLKRKSKSKAVLPENPRILFDCRVINNPYELLKMGYSPSKDCWKKYFESENLPTPVNDYDVGEEFKKVA